LAASIQTEQNSKSTTAFEVAALLRPAAAGKAAFASLQAGWTPGFQNAKVRLACQIVKSSYDKFKALSHRNLRKEVRRRPDFLPLCRNLPRE
jgi:hypothetical protein